ncbi:hypothetical protein CC79DRAFT_256140 [Sarocladium strictum]
MVLNEHHDLYSWCLTGQQPEGKEPQDWLPPRQLKSEASCARRLDKQKQRHVAAEQWKPTIVVPRHEHVGILSALSSLSVRSSVVGHLGNQENIGRQTWKVPSRYYGSGPGCVSTPSWRIYRSAQSLCEEPFLAKDTLVKGGEGRLHWPAEASRQWSLAKLQIECWKSCKCSAMSLDIRGESIRGPRLLNSTISGWLSERCVVNEATSKSVRRVRYFAQCPERLTGVGEDDLDEICNASAPCLEGSACKGTVTGGLPQKTVSDL